MGVGGSRKVPLRATYRTTTKAGSVRSEGRGGTSRVKRHKRATLQDAARGGRPPREAGERTGRQRLAHLARCQRGCVLARRAPVRDRLTAPARRCTARPYQGELSVRAFARCRGRCGLRNARVRVPRLTVSPGAVLDSSAQILFLTEMFRGMSLTLKYFFEPKVTVRLPASKRLHPVTFGC